MIGEKPEKDKQLWGWGVGRTDLPEMETHQNPSMMYFFSKCAGIGT